MDPLLEMLRLLASRVRSQQTGHCARTFALELRFCLQVDGYGGIHAIDYLDYYMNNTYGVPASAYMHVMLRTLLSLHYAQFVTLRGVPYDWRLPPWQVKKPSETGGGQQRCVGES